MYAVVGVVSLSSLMLTLALSVGYYWPINTVCCRSYLPIPIIRATGACSLPEVGLGPSPHALFASAGLCFRLAIRFFLMIAQATPRYVGSRHTPPPVLDETLIHIDLRAQNRARAQHLPRRSRLLAATAPCTRGANMAATQAPEEGYVCPLYFLCVRGL